MSGIAGAYCPQAGAETAGLERIHQALRHRGDSQSLHFAGPVGLSYHCWANHSLAALKPQPVFVHDCWVVADARLDNRDELCRALPVEPGRASDAELIAGAYARWGTDCPSRLDGDFAFALWDTRRERLFCARDPLGVRPFFYRWHSPRFTWASEVKALLADPDYARAPDEAMLAEYLLGWSHFPDAGATFYQGIRQLPAGHSLTLEADRLGVQRYWDINPAEEARYRRPFAENVEEFRHLFERAVERRLGGADAVAVLLSGGVDSTSISSVAESWRRSNGHSPQSLSHLCSYFVAPHGDERRYVQCFQEKYSSAVEYLSPKPFRVLEDMEPLVDLEENPFLDLTWSLTQQWTEQLRTLGCPVALTGFGGDNIFPDGGPSCCADVWRRHGWRAGWQALRRTAAYYGVSTPAFLWPTLRLLLPDSLKKTAKRWLGKEIAPWLRPEFARRSGLLERVRQPLPRRGFSSLLQELDYCHLASGRLALYLGYLDRLAGARGLEFRHPFLDPALVRLTLLAPPEHKAVNGETKLLLRQAMAGIVPEAVRQRRDKGGPSRFLATWIRRHEAETWQKLARGVQRLAPYVKLPQVSAVVERFLEGDDTALKPAWTLLSAELWLRNSFASRPRE